MWKIWEWGLVWKADVSVRMFGAIKKRKISSKWLNQLGTPIFSKGRSLDLGKFQD